MINNYTQQKPSATVE